MPNLNRVMLIGNLTRDPVMRVTPAGMQICEFGLGVNRSFRTAQGELREEACFIQISCFGKQAETCNRYLRKGAPVYVEGRLKQDRWEDKRSGEKRQAITVVMERMQLLAPGPSPRGDGAQVQGVTMPSTPTGTVRDSAPKTMPPFTGAENMSPPTEIVVEENDDDIPF